MVKGLSAQRLLALFVAGWLLFTFPLLALWDRDALLWGLPLFPAALFLIWVALIVLLAWIVESSADDKDAAAPRPGGRRDTLPDVPATPPRTLPETPLETPLETPPASPREALPEALPEAPPERLPASLPDMPPGMPPRSR